MSDSLYELLVALYCFGIDVYKYIIGVTPELIFQESVWPYCERAIEIHQWIKIMNGQVKQNNI